MNFKEDTADDEEDDDVGKTLNNDNVII